MGCVAAEFDGQQAMFRSSENLGCIEDGLVSLVATSPPYWDLKNYGHPDEIGQEPYDAYLKRLAAVWGECHRVTRPGAVMVVNVANRRKNKRFYPLAFDIARDTPGWTLWDILIWYVPNALPQPNHYQERLFDQKYEFLLVFVRDGDLGYTFHKPRVPQKYGEVDPRSHKLNGDGRCIGSVIRVPAYRPPNIREGSYHVAAWPEELVALLVETFTSPGDVVLDPFLGYRHSNRCLCLVGRPGPYHPSRSVCASSWPRSIRVKGSRGGRRPGAELGERSRMEVGQVVSVAWS